MSVLTRPQKITFGEMRAAGVRGLLIYCSDYKCSHGTAISGEQWSDHVRLSDLESRFICQACGKRGADVRPDFYWNKSPVAAMGYRRAVVEPFDDPILLAAVSKALCRFVLRQLVQMQPGPSLR